MRNDGFHFSGIYFTADRQRHTGANFRANTSAAIEIKDLTGMNAVQGKFHLGASISICKEEGQLVMNNPDILSAYDAAGLDPIEVHLLTFPFDLGSPFRSGEHYTLHFSLWDKNGKAKMKVEQSFFILPD